MALGAVTASAPADEPEPEPSVKDLEKGILECPTAEALIQRCLEGSVSPVEFKVSPELVREFRDNFVESDSGEAFGVPSFHARVTRKMTREEKEGPGREALQLEVSKLVEHGLFGKPILESEAIKVMPDVTVSGVALLGHVKFAEKQDSSLHKYKGRAVILGDAIQDLSTGRPARAHPDVPTGDVARLEEVRCLAAYATMSGHPAQSIDIQNAYLNVAFETPEGRPIHHVLRLPGNVREMLPSDLQPERGPGRWVWPMLRAGYGHPISGHLFINKIKKKLFALGFSQLDGTAALFSKGSILLGAYVDDILCVGDAEELSIFWSQLGAEFIFGDEPKECREFLGISFSRYEEGEFRVCHLTLGDYIKDTVKVYEEMWGCKVRPSLTAGTETVRSFDPETPETDAPRPLHNLQSIIGRLLWICRTVRPELSHMASGFGGRVLTWRADCDAQLFKCMGFLALTAEAALEFRWPKTLSLDQESVRVFASIHVDSDWLTPRSQSGFVSNISCGSEEDCVSGYLPIHWNSKKQSIAADSSTSAEVIATHFGIKGSFNIMRSFVDWVALRGLFGSRDTPKIMIRIDNSTALKFLLEAPTETFGVYSKAILVRRNLLRDLVLMGIFGANKVASELNRSDVLTKCFGNKEFINKAELAGVTFKNCSAVGRSAVAQVARGVFWFRANCSVWI